MRYTYLTFSPCSNSYRHCVIALTGAPQLPQLFALVKSRVDKVVVSTQRSLHCVSKRLSCSHKITGGGWTGCFVDRDLN